ncbi:class I SAM-dependent methyltransferase [Polymorphum gilvum]|uniref:Methyltransferase domain family protein n=1 Tax=Polymorphum gilvum (strain LMG 25793 / CGMCC 1.9160 / SL003B-26A1) TaxID=991905 RepID=F2IVM3_POLGS|nr:rRNA adenine N-6-methyltransferase family protein [Polymorphum gilvum]ADZ72741.1 Methyltransferase domain family protein [Polymorphum gilvum SL003B-26A1]
MSAEKTLKSKTLLDKIQDELRFFRGWVDSPLTMGAISPSGPELARRIASFLPVRPGGRYLELGPGTGVVTKAIFDRGVRPEDLVTIEYNADFCRLLRQRYPALTTIQGDAYALRKTLEQLGPVESGSLAGIVSGLPLFTRPPEVRQTLIEEGLALLEPGAPFIQFSYAFVPPVKPVPGWLELSRTDWIFRNLPPARVWVYRRPA